MSTEYLLSGFFPDVTCAFHRPDETETPAEDALEDDSAAGAGEAGTSENGYVDEETRSGQRVAERGYDLSSDPEAAVFALADRFEAPWTLNELPMMDEWLKNNGPALDLVSRAVRQPVFCVPLVREDREDENGTLWDLLLMSHVQQVRGFARGLSARAYYRIGTGQIYKAIDDIATCKRLGRHVQNGTMLVESLVGIAVEGIADSIGVGDVVKHPPTKEQLRRLLREMNDLPPRDPLQKTLRFERYFMLTGVQSLSQGKEAFKMALDAHPIISRCIETVGLDWNVIARRLNQHFDELLATGRAPPRASMYRLTAISVRERSKIVADVLGNLLLPGFEAVREATRRNQCVEHMKRITLAMLIYERDHRTLPPAYSADEDGNPLHSWRVLLLPYLRKQELYEKIRLDEPWDSEQNQQFHEEAVQFYRCPSDSVAGTGQTSYSVIVGPDVAFEAGTAKTLGEFGPNSNDMILLVERAIPVCWMDPTQEIPQKAAECGIDSEVVANGIASQHPGGANVGLRNGSVQFMSQTIDTELLKDQLHGKNTERGD